MTQPLCSRASRTHALCACPAVKLALTLFIIGTAVGHLPAREVSPERLTPVVRAVRQARPSVVSIQGQKTVASSVESVSGADTTRQVNGMGTGTIIDERGYILTNYHVVSDVRRIEITLDDGRGYTADLVAYEAATDLAVIKIPAPKPLPVIRFGTSSDLMEGESVIALGNAFGYEQTVTRGIISALGRDVQVSDTQSYDDLIQTDASINPGNSGGPLLNIDGEMIGVNVAVRAGAQGIGFAIPIDQALQTAAKLLNVQRLQGKRHGLVTRGSADPTAPLRVAKVEAASPAEMAGLKPGDEILRIGTLTTARPLDLERAFLDREAGEPVVMEVRRGKETLELDLALVKQLSGAAPQRVASNNKPADAWSALGLRLTEEPRTTFQRRSTRYRGGMRVEAVRPDSPAAQEGIMTGDILVGMHRWETASDEDIQYIISRPNLADMGKIKFYVLRGQNTLYGHLNVASRPNSSTKTR
ncbi:MAG TPA: trypsin-like peptidase domain-containing protein [Lacipirellulaceae bacterium]|nr:trypsin-like peptidase domain-containing protein [Lacipirellulaceae bacterium]